MTSKFELLSRYGFMLAAIWPLSERAFSQDHGFVTYPSDFNVRSGSEIIIKYIPPVRDQGQLGLCYGFAAASAIDIATCFDQNMTPGQCSSLPRKNMASSLSLAKLSSFDGSPLWNSLPLAGEKVSAGGYSGAVLWNAMYGTGVCIESEESYPFDKWQHMSQSEWDAIRDVYSKYHDEMIRQANYYNILPDLQIASDAIFALTGVKRRYELWKILATLNYSEFLGTLLDPGDCRYSVEAPQPWLWELRNGDNFEFNNDKISRKRSFDNYHDAKASIVEILKLDTAVVVDGYCATEDKPETEEQCRGHSHSILVVGFREICASSGECHDELKLQNSWGSAWQEQTGGGWVDAKEFLDRTFYEPWAFLWLEPQE